jgi:outer membrane receptor protein involved in Fe transport
MPSAHFPLLHAAGWVLLSASAAAQTPAPAPAVPASVPAATPAGEPAAANKGVKADASSAPAPEPEAEMASVTVSAERPTNRIDRQVYDVKADAASSNASLADALNKVPSVAVDPDGTVTLRGSTNVQIMIDGKPSAMMQGDNRGATLNAMVAEGVESIEVINNPGAQFGNDGGGGPILNLVTRRDRRPGGFTTVNANGGTGGRYNGATFGSYNEGRWGLQGSLNVRHDGRNATGDIVRDRTSAATGERSHTVQHSRQEGLNDSAGLNGAVTYNLGQRDTLQANVSYLTRSNDNRSRDSYLLTDAGQATLSDYTRTTRRGGDNNTYSWGGRLDHKGDTDGELFKLDLRVSGAANRNDSAYTNVYLVRPTGRIDAQARQANSTDNRIADFSGDYERPVGLAMLKLGFKAASNHNDIDARFFDINPQTGAEAVNAIRTNRFQFNEKVLALYGSWQMRLSERWGVMGGLRTEYTDLDLQQITTGVRAGNNYVNVIPSFFATYKLSGESNLRLAYANRLRRPSAYNLNPFVVYGDEFNISTGNPRLKPTRTNSFELGYESRLFGLDANLRGYYRQDSDAILPRRTYVSETVLLSTSDNGPGTSSSGLELTLSGKLLPALSLNASGNLARSEQRILDQAGIDNRRTANSLSGRVRLNYQVTPDTSVQSTVQTQGRMLTGQGYREPVTTVGFSARHALTPRMNLVLDVQDAFNGNRIESVTDTSMLRETSIRQFDGRVVYLGLTYRFGGATPTARRPGGARQGPGAGGGRQPG